jgi:hypothetical protein
MKFLIIILIIILILFKKNSKATFSETGKVCILLTTCVQTKMKYEKSKMIKTDIDRLNLYKEVIQKWLDNTNFDIYCVESSGYDFNNDFGNNPRFKCYTFISDNKYNCRNCSATPYEAESILKALDNLNFDKFDKIFKVTGKYYLPGFEKLVQDIPDSAQIYFQNKRNIFQQNSEFFGSKKEFFRKIIEIVLSNSYKNMNFESTLNTIKNMYSIYRFPEIKLEKPIERGDGSVYNTL